MHDHRPLDVPPSSVIRQIGDYRTVVTVACLVAEAEGIVADIEDGNEVDRNGVLLGSGNVVGFSSHLSCIVVLLGDRQDLKIGFGLTVNISLP